MATNTYVTITQAAAALGVARNTVYYWLATGRLTRHTVAGTSFVTVDKLYRNEVGK